MPSNLINSPLFQNKIDAANSENNIRDKWLSTKEAAEYLRISPGSVLNMISNGTIKPSGKLGRLNRFLESDLKKLLLVNK